MGFEKLDLFGLEVQNVKFGSGDINVGLLKNMETGEKNTLFFHQLSKKYEIGDICITKHESVRRDQLRSVANGNCLAFTFTNPDSVDVVISALEEVKLGLNKMAEELR